MTEITFTEEEKAAVALLAEGLSEWYRETCMEFQADGIPAITLSAILHNIIQRTCELNGLADRWEPTVAAVNAVIGDPKFVQQNYINTESIH